MWSGPPPAPAAPSFLRFRLEALAQYLANFHQNQPKLVFAAAIGAAAPIVIVGRALDDALVAGPQQDGANIGVRLKFFQHGLAHDLVLHLLPIGAQRVL